MDSHAGLHEGSSLSRAAVPVDHAKVSYVRTSPVALAPLNPSLPLPLWSPPFSKCYRNKRYATRATFWALNLAVSLHKKPPAHNTCAVEWDPVGVEGEEVQAWRPKDDASVRIL